MEDYGTKWVDFTQIPNTSYQAITEIWNICTKQGESLGQIRFQATWRRYVFHPDEALFDAGCLRDIAIHIDKLMIARARRLKARYTAVIGGKVHDFR